MELNKVEEELKSFYDDWFDYGINRSSFWNFYLRLLGLGFNTLWNNLDKFHPAFLQRSEKYREALSTIEKTIQKQKGMIIMYEELKEGMYENTFCMKEDYLLEEATGGNIDAMYLLATLYYEDDQMDNAYKWFCKAAEKGQADATYYIGNFYCHPTGWDLVEPSNEKAINYYTKALDLGSAKAMSELGKLYLQGTVAVEKDETKAFDLFKKAAELGDSEGYYWLAMCYRYGRGIEKDFEKAFNYAIKAYNAIY